MITVVCSSQLPLEKFKQHIIKTSGLKNIEFLGYENKGKYSLTEIYNRGLNEAKYDIVVFTHHDVLLKEGWGKKIIKHFNNTDFGILGMAGTTDMPEIGRWWQDSTKMIGIVSHSHEGKTWENKYSANFEDEVIETVILDGLFFVAHKKRIKVGFNENFKGFHFYDIDFTFNNHLQGVKVGVIFDVKIIHKSIGTTNEEWEKNRIQFTEIYKDKLPHKIKPEIRFENKVINLKEKPKLAIIIPTKGNVVLLTQCVDSIIKNTEYNNYTIYIADTGSTPAEKEEIKKTYENVSSIKLLEYDFYNFAVINNDVVENHIAKDTELLLFCNNDIKVLNNAIVRMLDVYVKNKKTVGTIGARLHYGDNTVQHSGVMMFLKQDGSNPPIGISHYGLRSYYTYHPSLKRDILGNTAAFMMINKKLFTEIGGFDHTYRECFEDVQLNIECINRHLDNIFVGDAVCYHFESQTRNKSEEKLRRESEDYTKKLIPFILKNKKTYNYFSNIKAKDFEAMIEKSRQEQLNKNNEVRSFV